MGITPFISYEGGSIDDVTEDFHNAVDEYLEFCVDTGKKPEISNPNTAPTAIF
jgi:predicted HicB family RNase H-like nuclease